MKKAEAQAMKTTGTQNMKKAETHIAKKAEAQIVKKLTKKTFALLLSLALLAAVFPASPLPTMAETSGDYEYWTIDEAAKTCVIIKYTGSGGDVVIPSKLDGYTVTEIRGYYAGTGRYYYGAFTYGGGLTSVKIPDGVLSISDCAFAGHKTLTSVTLPKNLTTIGYGAFAGCTSLTNVTLPDKVKKISDYAFYRTNLTSVTIPAGLTSIDSAPFSDCPNLTQISVDARNSEYRSVDGVLFNKAKTKLVQCPGGKQGCCDIPNGVTEIGVGAFCGCKFLTSVKIPDSVTTIGDGYMEKRYLVQEITARSAEAFAGCTSLANVTIGKSVTKIGHYAFHGCTSLTSVTIPDSVTEIGEHAFEGCTSLTSVTIPDSVTMIGWSAFGGCTSLTSVTIGNSVTSIDWHAFEGCTSLTSVTIPDSVTTIGWNAFAGCNNLQCNTYDNAKYLGNGTNPCVVLMSAKNSEITACKAHTDTKIIYSGAFGGCTSLTSVTMGNSITEIGEQAFRGCTSLTSIETPNSVTYIRSSAFRDCTSLTSVIIPDNVTEIESCVFDGCTNLQYNTYDNGKYLGDETNPYVVLVKAKNQSIAACKTHPNTKIIYDYAFDSCTSLTSVTISNSVTSIGYCAFFRCGSLTSVTMGNGVKTISWGAFCYCGSLTDVYYAGTEEQWMAIEIDNMDRSNEPLMNATIHYNCAPSAAAVTYTVTLTDNGDGTATIKATIPANIISGKIVVTPSGNLTFTAGSLGYDTPEQTVSNENYDKDGVAGQCVVFMSSNLEVLPEGLIAFRAEYRVKKGARLSADDITVKIWNLIAAGEVEYLATQDDGDVIKVFVPAPPASPVPKGDVTGDGFADNMDAAKILQYDAGLIGATDALLAAGDVTGDGAVDNMDAAKILKFDAGLISSL